MFQIANKLFNELVEQYCVENNIDPMKMLENESEIDPSKNPNRCMNLAKDVRIGSGINLYTFPRSNEPIHLMVMYTNTEMGDTVPKPFIKQCHKARDKWRKGQKKTFPRSNNPITKHVSYRVVQ